MSISKEQWAEIEEGMTRLFCHYDFSLDGHLISVQKVRVSENKQALTVYVDGEIKGKWLLEGNERPAVIEKVWRQCSKARYTAKFIKSMEKIYGKRKAKNEFPDLHERRYYRVPEFNTAKSLVRQFKKLEGLELVTKLQEPQVA